MDVCIIVLPIYFLCKLSLMIEERKKMHTCDVLQTVSAPKKPKDAHPCCIYYDRTGARGVLFNVFNNPTSTIDRFK